MESTLLIINIKGECSNYEKTFMYYYGIRFIGRMWTE